jgi:hypothetical protein
LTGKKFPVDVGQDRRWYGTDAKATDKAAALSSESAIDSIMLTSSAALENQTVATATIRASVEVSGDGNSFSGQYTLGVTGVPGAESEYGPETVTGTRLVVEQMGTPVGPTSALDALIERATAEATPTP